METEYQDSERIHSQEGRFDRFHYLVFALVALIARLPMWLSEKLPLNGDESILALMGKHLSEGRDISIFFYGQRYGLALFESIAIAVGFKIGGVNDLSYRVAMLLLWVLGVSFFFGFLKRALPRSLPASYRWLVCLCLVLTPAWMRLGYVSPFLFTFVLLYVIALDRKSWWNALLIGLLIVLVAESHRLWLPPIILITAALGSSRWSRKQWLQVLGFCLLGFGSMAIYRAGLHDAWHPVVMDLDALDLERVSLLPRKLRDAMTGHYYLSDIYTAPLLVHWATRAFFLLIGTTLIGWIWWLKKKGGGEKDDRMLLLALLVTLLCLPLIALITRQESLRYLVPFAQFAFIFLGLGLWRLGKKAAHVLLLGLLVLSIGSAYAFKDYSFYTVPESSLIELNEEFERAGVNTAFCTEPLVQWQIMFYSNEEVVCRYTGATDRYPAYVEACDRVLLEQGGTALVGRKWKIPKLSPDYICADGEMAIYYDISRSELEELGFEIGDPKLDSE